MARVDISSSLIPEDMSLHSYVGYVQIGSVEVKIRIEGIEGLPGGMHPPTPHTATGTSYIPSNFAYNSANYTQKTWLQKASSLCDFIRDLQEMLSVESDRMARCVASQAVDAPPCTKPPAASYYKQLVDDIETIGWESLISLNEALNVLEVQIADQQGRNHSLRVEFASDYPSTCPLLAVDAPCEFYPPWESTAWNLKGIIDHFRSNFLPQFSAFWDVMDDLDAHCIVLEPSRPQRSMTHRRIAIEKHISIDIEILDPLRPFSICKLEFFGKETSIECFRRRWSENISSWDDSGHTLLRSNLESILGLCFPGPLMESIGDFQLEDAP
ncbi:hypothetical protein ABG067_003997 [Albugo candida]